MSEPTTEHRRAVSAAGMPLWRKFEIVIALLRAASRGLLKPPRQMPILHPHVKVRAWRGNLELGKFCELHNRVVLSVIGRPDAPASLKIGDLTSIWYGTVISARHEVSIGRDCAISWNCTILDNDMHEIIDFPETEKRPRGDYVRIEDHVWIGAGSTILKGVTIGKNSIVAAGSLVTRDVPPNTLVAGSPAKPIRQVEGWR